MFSVALSVPYGPSSYEAHRPVEFGLSSPFSEAIARLPAQFLKNTFLSSYAVQQILQIRGQGRVELQYFTCPWMSESKVRRVKKIPTEVSVLFHKRLLLTFAVNVVA